MSREYNRRKNMESIPVIGPEQVPSPVNCKHPCPYGKGRAFCFPCMERLVATMKKNEI